DKNLLRVTKESLFMGIERAVTGNRIGDISYEIQQFVEKNGFSVVREMVGHGIGKKLHESPEVPNFGKRGDGKRLQEGMVICIEPMVNAGSRSVHIHDDGWTLSTADKKRSAHFELMVAVTSDKPMILSTFEYIESKNI
ncbi:MAG: M24 family metallopeptidase, partial [Bacteroidales bacterium]|nr:M24 family metallopeptidase [Bacteroidales bacterium]